MKQDPRQIDVLAATSCSVVVTDATLRGNPIAYANAAFSTLTGYAADEVLGRNCRFLQGADTDASVVSEIRAAIAAGTRIRREILNYRKDGTPFWNDLTIDPIRDATGELKGFIGVQHQADAAHLATQKKAEVESRLASIADHIAGFIYQRVMRTDGTIELLYLSPSIRALLGIEGAEAARRFFDHVHPDDQDGLIARIRASAATMSPFQEEFRLVSSSGATHWLRSEAPPRRLENGEIIWDGLAVEISAEKRWESEIANQARRDPLTGLLTRAAWRQALTTYLHVRRADARRCAALYIDIKEFREHNNRVGQAGGDQILRETAVRLGEIATSVGGVAARLGGDEFAVLLPDCASENELSQIALRSGDMLARPIRVGPTDSVIQTCIGATFYARSDDGVADDDAASEVTNQAEIALRGAKQAGCSGHVLYSAAEDDRFKNQTILARSLERGIADGEFELHYQPLVDLASGRIVSAEALVRWRHPVLGMQRPDLFIPLAEKSGLIVPLGAWVLEEALRHRRQWQEAGLTPPPIALNVSGVQLLDPGFVALVERALSMPGATAQGLELELTEGLLIEPSPQVLASLHALRRMGFTVAIDDFGSGHATFRYLRDFPVDKLKLDQIFVRKLVLDSADVLIIRAVMSLARSMAIGFVAEGIETEMQRDFLQQEGCQIGQGYFFSMPLVAEDFAWMLANDVRLPLEKPIRRLEPDRNKGKKPDREPQAA